MKTGSLLSHNVMAAASKSETTYDLSLLEQSRQKWKASSGIRATYESIYREMTSFAKGDRWLELGSGAGFFKLSHPNVSTSDIEKTKYVDLEVSAYDIEATATDWDTIFAMDMLHHLTKPLDFFLSASKSLAAGGRIVLAEPAATRLGLRFYKAFHHEPCDPQTIKEPFEFETDENGEFANMGMGVALFENRHGQLEKLLAEMGLHIHRLSYRDVLAYPATGGLSKPQLLPTFAISSLLKLERHLSQGILRTIGLRMIIVIERRP